MAGMPAQFDAAQHPMPDITVLAADKARFALRPCRRLRAAIFGRGRLRRDADLSLQRDVTLPLACSVYSSVPPGPLCDLRGNTISRIEQKTILQMGVALGCRRVAMAKQLAGHNQRLTLHHRL